MNLIVISLIVAVCYIIFQYVLNKVQHGDKSLKMIVKDAFAVMISTIAACYIYDIIYPSKDSMEIIAPVFTDKAPF
jgi:hypothetical protein